MSANPDVKPVRPSDMSVNPDFKLLKEKKIDKETRLKVTKNLMSGRIFVEFSSVNPNIVLQKNFPDSLDGKKNSEEFAKSIKNTLQFGPNNLFIKLADCSWFIVYKVGRVNI